MTELHIPEYLHDGNPSHLHYTKVDIHIFRPVPEIHMQRIAVPLLMEPKTWLRKTSSTSVVEAVIMQICHSSQSLSREEPVVCKVAYGAEAHMKLCEEARIYRKLERLQGHIVPYIWGFFWNRSEKYPVSVLVMEDGGEPLPRPLSEVPVSFRYARLFETRSFVSEGLTLHIEA